MIDDKTCGPLNANKKCTGTAWCSQWGWCGTTTAYKYDTNSAFNGPNTGIALQNQCKADQLYVDSLGHDCTYLKTDSRSMQNSTDVTGKVAGQYCKRWCGAVENVTPGATPDDKKCGPLNANKKCTGVAWCSKWGWCGTTAEYKHDANSAFNGINTATASPPAKSIPLSCANPTAPANSQKGQPWKDLLGSGESNSVKCDYGFTPTNNGKIQCNNGILKLAECMPEPCANPTAPANARKGLMWKDKLGSGETNSVQCNAGFTPTNDGKNTCNKGSLVAVECKRKTTKQGTQIIAYGNPGQTCNEACASLSGMRCEDAVQGSDITYTREIFNVANAANPTGKGGNKDDGWEEWVGDHRSRPESTLERVPHYYHTQDCQATPGIWQKDNGTTTFDWKAPSDKTCPSKCDKKWGDLIRICACTPK
jgi:hypothetical protein